MFVSRLGCCYPTVVMMESAHSRLKANPAHCGRPLFNGSMGRIHSQSQAGDFIIPTVASGDLTARTNPKIRD